MEDERKKSKFLVVIFWLSTLGCFAFGYYNTVEAFRTYGAFGIDNPVGNWFIALIPLVMVFGGYLASVQGRRKMLYLYLAGEIIFFAANLTYLYPQKLGRILVNEEAQMLKDSVTVYQGKLDKIANKGDSYSLAKLQRLREFQSNLLTEIKDRNGFGQYATEQLKHYNELAGTSYTPERYVGKTPEERQKYYDDWKKKTDEGIKNFIVQLNGNDKSAEKIVTAKYEMDVIAFEYNPKLEIILDDKSKVILSEDAIANNSQIALLEDLAGKLDKVALDVNSVKQPAPFNKIIDMEKGISFPKTKKLGDMDFAFISAIDRINKLDTWIVIILCFFFDLLGPFLFYFYLRNEEDEFDSAGVDNWDIPWWKKLFGIQ
ncbi:MAG: tetraspanin family protein [Planctomycetaceae bacterium]|jgi:hypothetical protein|nr:tetraspanin family protein [Planctomycetaceae bacterium]